MPPTIAFSGPPPSRLYLFRGTFTLFSVGIQLCTRLVRQVLVFLFGGNTNSRSIPSHAKREFVHLTTSVERRATPIDSHHPHFVLFIILIPVLVLLSGLFAGLTLGYMSLDETQLYVLSVGGTAEQRTYANEIIPLRKNGHRLLVTLLLANMIVNESLPVIADPVLGGGVQGVAVSTVLIVIFAEIIPQSLFSRHGLYLGAKMAGLTRCLMFALAIIAWPVAKLLDIVIGHHRGLIYRHNELKELIALHSANETQGGDLCQNAVKLVGAALDLQHKVVKEIMTDIKDVFMLSIESKLDDETLKVIHERGQSKIPVYEEIELSTSASVSTNGSDIPSETVGATKNCRVKRITDVLLMKDCVLLDRRDAIPIYNMPLVKPIFVSGDEPLFGLLDAFRESRSHMAIVTRPIGRTADPARGELAQVGAGQHTSLSPSVSLHRASLSRIAPERVAPLCPNDVLPGASTGGTIDSPSTTQESRETSTLEADKVHEHLAEQSEGDTPGGEEIYLHPDPAIVPIGTVTLDDIFRELIGETIPDHHQHVSRPHLPSQDLPSLHWGKKGQEASEPLSVFASAKDTYARVARSRSAPPPSRRTRSSESCIMIQGLCQGGFGG